MKLYVLLTVCNDHDFDLATITLAFCLKMYTNDLFFGKSTRYKRNNALEAIIQKAHVVL